METRLVNSSCTTHRPLFRLIPATMLLSALLGITPSLVRAESDDTGKKVQFSNDTIDNEHKATRPSTTKTVNGVKQDKLNEDEIKAIR